MTLAVSRHEVQVLWHMMIILLLWRKIISSSFLPGCVSTAQVTVQRLPKWQDNVLPCSESSTTSTCPLQRAAHLYGVPKMV